MHSLDHLATPLVVGGIAITNRVFLAPMSGITDEPFRKRAIAHGAGLAVSEMVASGELARGRHGSALRIVRPDVPIHMVQLAGREARWLAEGARIAVGEGADIIDINMGCPAKKVTGGYCGSALMREPGHALALIEAVVAAVDVPVTVKMRLGWDDASRNAAEIAARAEASGVSMITVHGRTRCQFYSGSADWQAIARVKRAVSIPVVVNGDVTDPAGAAQALALSGADAVMIGRAHYGAPWIAGEIAARAAGVVASRVPGDASAMVDYVIAHYEDMLSFYGTASGLRQARKHLGWYVARHAPWADAKQRKTAMTADEPALVIAALRRIFGSEIAEPARAAA